VLADPRLVAELLCEQDGFTILLQDLCVVAVGVVQRHHEQTKHHRIRRCVHCRVQSPRITMRSEFPDERAVLLTLLCEGQSATMLPAAARPRKMPRSASPRAFFLAARVSARLADARKCGRPVSEKTHPTAPAALISQPEHMTAAPRRAGGLFPTRRGLGHRRCQRAGGDAFQCSTNIWVSRHGGRRRSKSAP
jgi:hypothetical protein